MKRLLVALFVSLVLLQSYATAAEDVCYQYQFGSDGWVNSAAEAVAQVQHYCTVTDAAASPHTCAGGVFGTCTYSGFVDAGFISGAEHINYNYSCNGGSTFSFHQNVARRVNPAGCPPDPCSSVATTANALGGSVRNGSGDTSGTFCGEVLGNSDADIHHCEATVVGVVTKSGDNWAAQMHWSGRSCDAAPGAGGPDVGGADAANCVTNSKGTVCASTAERNCGTFNGEKVCLNAVPPGKCVLISDGAAVCDSTADSPPAPDDGAGSPASPDAQVELVGADGGSTTFNYFGGGTVGASSSGVQGQQPGSADHQPGDSDGAGDTPGADGPSGYGSLPDDVTTCNGDLEACAQGKATGAYVHLLADVPLLGLVSSLDAAFDSTPSCPQANLSFFGHQYDVMASVCSVVDSNAALVALVFRIGWAFAALRILLKAE